MRLALPRYKLVFLLCVVGLIGGGISWTFYHDPTVYQHLLKGRGADWAELIGAAFALTFFTYMLFTLLRDYPLTYCGGFCSTKTQVLSPGDTLSIGPLAEVAGRHLTLIVYLSGRPSSLLRRIFRPNRDKVRIAVAPDADRCPLFQGGFDVSDGTSDTLADTNHVEIDLDVPPDVTSCSIVIEPLDTTGPIRVTARIVMGLKWWYVFDAPMVDHFSQMESRIHQR